MEDCIFCKIAKGEVPSTKIVESENFMVIRDVNPQVRGHLLTIPKTHCETFLDLPEKLYKELLTTTKDAIYKSGIKKFNLVVNNGKIAGQIIPHLHLHILPRKKDDGFKIGP